MERERARRYQIADDDRSCSFNGPERPGVLRNTVTDDRGFQGRAGEERAGALTTHNEGVFRGTEIGDFAAVGEDLENRSVSRAARIVGKLDRRGASRPGDDLRS